MKLDFNTYRSKVRGCYLGKTIGGTLGAPFECYRGVYDVDGFMQDISEPVPNDDVDLQLVWLAAAEREGKNIDSHVLAEYWTTYVSAAFSEYGTGKNNFRMGILPPLSGYMRNENRNSNGAWIRTEIWACLCAGNPALAATYAYYDACVDHSGEGVYAAVFMAAVQAAAFFESDVHKLIAIGLSYIPAACGVRSAVELVLSCRRKGDTWKQARKKLLCTLPSSFGEMMGEWQGTAQVPASKKCPVQTKDPDIPKAEFGYDAPASIGIILIGWLWGEGDFGKSICLAVNCGEDTDCTAGTLGATLGIICGDGGIPACWTKACSEKIATCTLRTDELLHVPKDVTELCERIVRRTPVFLRGACTFSEGGGFEVAAERSLAYTPNAFRPYEQEDIMVLLSEQPATVRMHFRPLTVRVTYDAALAKVEEGVPKTLDVTLENRLYLPQYCTLRLLEVPEGWQVRGGTQRCAGLEHWHGGHNENRVRFEIVPGTLTQARYTLILEISTNGRGERHYVPLTFLNGAC